MGEAPGIANQIPKSCKAADALQISERQLGVRQNVVRWLRVVAHRKRIGVTNNRRAAQAFQHADLNLVRPQTRERIEAFTKARKRFRRQTCDQIYMHVRMRIFVQPTNVRFRFVVVLFARNVTLHGGVPSLNADLKLQRSCGEFRDGVFELFWQMIGHQFEVRKARIVGLSGDAFKEKIENCE